MRWICIFLFSLAAAGMQAQIKNNLLRMQPDSAFENVLVRKLASDSSATSFIIWVKKEVNLHYHAFHTETLMILEGTGTMVLGKETMDVTPGDFISIPPHTYHDLLVTSEEPLKALSVQAPEFLGRDRVFAGQLRKPDSRK